MKKILFALCAFILSGGAIYAQEESLNKQEKNLLKQEKMIDQDNLIGNDRFELHAGLETNHVWRGLIISDMPTVTGMLTLNLDQKKQWSMGFWGGTAISNDNDGTHYKEINYYVQYASKYFTIGLWDLYNTRGKNNSEVFDYDKDTSDHLLDLRTAYYLGDSFPMSLQANFILYGKGDQEAKYDSNDNAYYRDNDQRYSTYVEAAYPVYKGNVNVNAFIGCGFALDGDSHLYGDGDNSFDVVNFGLSANKKISIGNFTLPVSGLVFWNPSTEKVRMQLSTALF